MTSTVARAHSNLTVVASKLVDDRLTDFSSIVVSEDGTSFDCVTYRTGWFQSVNKLAAVPISITGTVSSNIGISFWRSKSGDSVESRMGKIFAFCVASSTFPTGR